MANARVNLGTRFQVKPYMVVESTVRNRHSLLQHCLQSKLLAGGWGQSFTIIADEMAQERVLGLPFATSRMIDPDELKR